jgi:hypothetical protein
MRLSGALSNPQVASTLERLVGTKVNIDVRTTKDQALSPETTLYSVVDGEFGPSLITVMLKARERALDQLAKGQNIFSRLENAEKFMLMLIELDLASFAARQLMRQYGAVRLERLGFELVVHIKQARFQQDRGEKLDSPVAGENYVTYQRSVITRSKIQGELGVLSLRTRSRGSPWPRRILSQRTPCSASSVSRGPRFRRSRATSGRRRS